MLPMVDFLMSHKPFDISREMDAILTPLGNETSLLAGSLQYESQGRQGDMSGRETQFHTGEEISSGNHSTLKPQQSAWRLATQYHPGMFNQTKIATRILDTFLKDDTSSERSRTNRRDATGWSSLDFITASGGTRSNLPPTSMLDFKPARAIDVRLYSELFAFENWDVFYFSQSTRLVFELVVSCHYNCTSTRTAGIVPAVSQFYRSRDPYTLPSRTYAIRSDDRCPPKRSRKYPGTHAIFYASS
ncbi:hypothetical protein FRC12_022916 [Ceratobasidium sp. 428]|nr:hypothetical protein FRC12_022916 [Ceratobasidium sp. 428]